MYYFIEDRLDAGISFYPFSSLRLDYDFRQGRLDYPEAWTLAQPDGGVRMVKRKDSQRSHAIGLTIRLFGNTGLGIQYPRLNGGPICRAIQYKDIWSEPT